MNFNIKVPDTGKNAYDEAEVQSTNSVLWHLECVLNRRCESYTDSSTHSMWLLYSHFAKCKMQICTAKHIIWLFPYHIPYQPETPISPREL